MITDYPPIANAETHPGCPHGDLPWLCTKASCKLMWNSAFEAGRRHAWLRAYDVALQALDAERQRVRREDRGLKNRIAYIGTRVTQALGHEYTLLENKIWRHMREKGQL